MARSIMTQRGLRAAAHGDLSSRGLTKISCSPAPSFGNWLGLAIVWGAFFCLRSSGCFEMMSSKRICFKTTDENKGLCNEGSLSRLPPASLVQVVSQRSHPRTAPKGSLTM